MAASRISQSHLDFHIARYNLGEPPITCWAFAVIPRECKDLAKIIYYLGGRQICYDTVLRSSVDTVAKIGTVAAGADLSTDICGRAFGLLEPTVDNSLSWFLRVLNYLQMSHFMDEKVCQKWLTLARQPSNPIRVFGKNVTERSLREAHLSQGDLVIGRCLMESFRRRGVDVASISLAGLPPGNSVKKVDEGRIEPDFYLQWRKVDVTNDRDRRWKPVFTARSFITPLFKIAASKPADMSTDWPCLRGIDYSCLDLASEDLEPGRDRQLRPHPDSFVYAWNPVVAEACPTTDPQNSEAIWTDICGLSDTTMASSATDGRRREPSGSAPRKASSSSWVTRAAPSVTHTHSQRADSIPASSQGDQRGCSTGPSSLREYFAPPKTSAEARRSTYRATRSGQAARGEMVKNEAFDKILGRYSTLSIKQRGGSSSDDSSLSTPTQMYGSSGGQ